MDIAVVGSGPAAEAVAAACADVDARAVEVDAGGVGAYEFAVVVAAAGNDAFAAADEAVPRWIAVEVGGVGGRAIADLDAAVAAFTPESARYRDLRARVTSTAESGTGRPRGDRSAVRLAGATAGRRLVRLLAGEDLGGTVVEVPGVEREFLPVPDPDGPDRALDRTHRDVGLEDALSRAERALDERTGLLTQVGERESFPVPYYLAQTADTTVYSDARAAELAAGVDADWDRAFMKALGEGLERYSAGVYRSGAFTTAPETNRARPVSPSRFVRPDDVRGASSDDPIQWVEGEDLASGESVSVPAEFVYYPPPEERHGPSITTGLGLGNAGVEALLSGLYEVIERDATMLAWYSTFEPLGVAPSGEGFEALVKRARAEGLSVTPMLVTQDVDVPVVSVAVHRGNPGAGDSTDPADARDDAGEAPGGPADAAGDGQWPRFAMGSSANLDPERAARSALAEALQNWMELRAMGRKRSLSEQGAVGRYGDFPEAAGRLVDVAGRVPAADVGPETLPTGTGELDAVLDRLADAGLDAYAVRLTPRDVERLGFEAVRAVIPEAQPLFVEDPFFGERAATVPGELGFEPRLDREYHPYP
ncbi:MAG: YcaO-like family protein [Salinigranum sp.]